MKIWYEVSVLELMPIKDSGGEILNHSFGKKSFEILQRNNCQWPQFINLLQPSNSSSIPQYHRTLNSNLNIASKDEGRGSVLNEDLV